MMKLVVEINLRYFAFWGEAKKFADTLSMEELDTIEAFMNEFEEPYTAEEINNFFKEKDYICECILGRDPADIE